MGREERFFVRRACNKALKTTLKAEIDAGAGTTHHRDPLRVQDP